MGTALITGASSGLGLEYAWQLATAGHNLVLVARNEERLNAEAERLRSATGVNVEVLRADLADSEQTAKVAARLTQHERPIGLLINNAGYGLGSTFIEDDIEREEAALAVMVRAVMVLSHAAARAMQERGRGAIMNISSVAANMMSGTYSAHKAWVRSFTESLAQELRGTGVTATAVLPGLTHTEFAERAGHEHEFEGMPDFIWLGADEVVQWSLADMRRGRVLSTPSLRYSILSQLARVAPRTLVRQVSRPL